MAYQTGSSNNCSVRSSVQGRSVVGTINPRGVELIDSTQFYSCPGPTNLSCQMRVSEVQGGHDLLPTQSNSIHRKFRVSRAFPNRSSNRSVRRQSQNITPSLLRHRHKSYFFVLLNLQCHLLSVTLAPYHLCVF